jgi:hypothetical protein
MGLPPQWELQVKELRGEAPYDTLKYIVLKLKDDESTFYAP